MILLTLYLSLNQDNNMVRACKPGQFTQGHLASLSLNDHLDYPNGCSPYGAMGSGRCSDDGFGWPDNTEYKWYSDGANCDMCNFRYGWERKGEPHGGYPNTCQDVSWGSCSVTTTGRRCSVSRQQYAGDKTSCCLGSMGGKKVLSTTGNINGSGFNWGRIGYDTYTCDPSVFHGGGCSADDVAGGVAKQCSRQDDETKKQWDATTGYCSAYMSGATPNAAGTVLHSALSKAYNSGVKIYTQDKVNLPYMSNLLQYCEAGRAAGVCDDVLKKFCSAYTREQVQEAYATYIKEGGDPTFSNKAGLSAKGRAALNIFKACACHLPTSDYSSWAQVGVDEVNVACDPLCDLGGISQYTKGKPAECHQNLCIIDGVTLNMVDSTSGNINFNIACGDCGGKKGKGKGSSAGSSACRCIFSDVKIFEQDAKVLGNLDFTMNCGGNCQMRDPDIPGKFIKIDCSSGKKIDDKPDRKSVV